MYPGAVVQYVFKNMADRRRNLNLELAVKTTSSRWFSDELGIKDAPDTVRLGPDGRFLARDTRHPWFALWGAVPSDRANRSSPNRYPRKEWVAQRPRVTRSCWSLTTARL